MLPPALDCCCCCSKRERRRVVPVGPGPGPPGDGDGLFRLSPPPGPLLPLGPIPEEPPVLTIEGPPSAAQIAAAPDLSREGQIYILTGPFRGPGSGGQRGRYPFYEDALVEYIKFFPLGPGEMVQIQEAPSGNIMIRASRGL